ncbi:MAG TPA: aminopeptidase P N-terminal domain-containing protein [Planctomycetota bacterium]|nr:aminopeptidase P N-terminal domain-containing protein [Planctomycetota bacterium]
MSPARERREEFMRRMGGGVAVIPNNPIQRRSNDVDFKFRPASDFYYLTAFPEPESVALFCPDRDRRFILFVRPKDREQEVWTGRRAGLEGARELYGADEAYPIASLDEEVPKLLGNAPKLFHRFGGDPGFDARVGGWLERLRTKGKLGIHAPGTIVDPGEILHEMRLRKSPDELERIRRAAAITEEAHRRAMREAKPGRNEWEVEALVDFAFRERGASGPAYPSIVAAGPNATVLHYTENARRLEAGDLLLLDAGSEVDCYASDVTRTFPVGRPFSPEQRALYELVLRAQGEAIAAVAPGVPFDEPHRRSVRALTEGLVSLGWLRGGVEELVEKGAFRRYFMHRTSHWLGLDVHDVGRYFVEGAPRRLEAGMVLTVEPGLYVAEDDAGVPPAFRGLGIRIEDDVLVTPAGRDVLTGEVPKTVEQVEAACAA